MRALGGALLAAVLGSGCAGSGARAAEPPDAFQASFAPAFDALSAAVRSRDDDLARRILERILAREPSGAARERARAFGVLLEGRRLAAGTRLWLACDGPVAAAGDVGVVLWIEHCEPAPLELSLPPASLRVLWTALDPQGNEQRLGRSLALGGLGGVRVEPGTRCAVPLGSFPLPWSGAIAVRASFELEVVMAEIARDGVAYPAESLPVAACGAVRLAPWLPSAPVEPAELVRYVTEETSFSTAAMLERAVRIDPGRREEALDLLAPVVLGADRVRALRWVPALRWLSGQSSIGADGERWRQWFEQRSRARSGAADTSGDGGLALSGGGRSR